MKRRSARRQGEPRSKKRRVQTEPLRWIYVTKVFQQHPRSTFVSVVGKAWVADRWWRVLVDVQEQRPFIYVRPVGETTMTLKLAARGSVRFVKHEPVLGRPLIGHQNEETTYIKMTLASEHDRTNLVQIMRRQPIQNVFEAHISMLSRFSAETGILEGGWFAVPESVALKRLAIDAPSVSKRLAKYVLRHWEFATGSIVQADIVRTASDPPFAEPEPVVEVTSFRYIFQNVYGEGAPQPTRPFPRWTNLLAKEWGTAGSDEFIPTPIDSICVTTRSYGVRSGACMGEKKRLFTTRSEVAARGEMSSKGIEVVSTVGGGRQAPEWLMKDRRSCRIEEKENRREAAMLREFVKFLSTCEVVVGFKLLDPLSDESIIYAMQRLLFFDVREYMPGTLSVSRINDAVTRGGNNPFPLSSCIDVLDYAKKDLSKNVPSSSFRTLYNTIMDPDEAGSWTGVVCHHETPLPYEVAFTYAKNVFSLVDHECLLVKTLTRSVNLGVAVDRVWVCREPDMMKYAMYRELVLLRKERGDLYVVGSYTENAWKSRDWHFTDPTDPSKGGRVLDVPHPLVTVSGFTLDFKAFYPSIVLSTGIGFTNILFNCRSQPEGVPQTTCVQAGDSVVRFAMGTGRKRPLYNVLRKLMDKRMALSTDDPYTAAENRAVKLLMNAIVGCLAFRGRFIFKCPAIGEIVRWVSRRLFDYCVNTVKLRSALYYDDSDGFSVRLPESPGRKIAAFDVVSGHTDGFDVVALDVNQPPDGKAFVDVGGHAEDIATKLAAHVAERICPSSTGIGGIPPAVWKCPLLQVERLFSRIIYLNKTTKVWAPLGLSRVVISKGTLDHELRHCRIVRGIYKEVLTTLLLDVEPCARIQSWLEEFDRRAEAAGAMDFAEFHRATRNRQKAKLNPSAMDPVAKTIAASQRSRRVEIPSEDQHVPVIWVKPTGGEGGTGFSSEAVLVHADLYDSGRHSVSKETYRRALRRVLVSLFRRIAEEQLV